MYITLGITGIFIHLRSCTKWEVQNNGYTEKNKIVHIINQLTYSLTTTFSRKIIPSLFSSQVSSWSSSFRDWMNLVLHHFDRHLLHFCMLMKQPTTAVFNPIQPILTHVLYVTVSTDRASIGNCVYWTHSTQLQAIIIS
jgi:hypothetical protein